MTKLLLMRGVSPLDECGNSGILSSEMMRESELYSECETECDIMWKTYAVLSAVFAALTAILAKFGVKDINSNLATAIRTSVILILTWSIVLFSGGLHHLRELTWKASAFLIASGLATGLSWLFYFKALQTGDVSKVAPIDKLSVVIVVIFGIVFLHEKLSWQVAAGTICIAAGTLFLLHGH